MTTYYTKREGRSMADLGVLPNNTDVWMVDEMVAAYVPVEREIYVTTCDNHSGGPASPHVLGCFKELAGIGETPFVHEEWCSIYKNKGGCDCAGVGETP